MRITVYTPTATATNENTEAMMRPGNVSETSDQLPTMCSTSAQHINASTSVTVSRHATRAAQRNERGDDGGQQEPRPPGSGFDPRGSPCTTTGWPFVVRLIVHWVVGNEPPLIRCARWSCQRT